MQFPWYEDEVDGPNVEYRETLLILVKMMYNAYAEPADPDWYDLGDNWPNVCFYSIWAVSAKLLIVFSLGPW